MLGCVGEAVFLKHVAVGNLVLLWNFFYYLELIIFS